MNKKIVVIHLLHELFGGVASVAASLINEQYHDGIVPIVIYVNEDSSFYSLFDFPIESYKVCKRSMIGSFMLFGFDCVEAIKKVKKKYMGFQVVIHAHNVQCIGLFSNLYSYNMVCTLHSMHGPEKTFRHKISDFIYKKILKKMKKNKNIIVSVSEALKKYYDPKDSIGINVIHNGTPIYGKKIINDYFCIGYIGDISYSKGFDKMMNLLSQINNPNIHFVCAGKNKSFTNEELENFFGNTQFDKNESYLGFIENAAKNILPEIDVLILLSKNEGLPMSIVEAFSYGIPVISTNVGGISEIIVDGCNGFLVYDDSQFFKAIESLICDRSYYEKISKKAFETYTGDFTSKIMAKKYKDFYYQVIDCKD